MINARQITYCEQPYFPLVLYDNDKELGTVVQSYLPNKFLWCLARISNKLLCSTSPYLSGSRVTCAQKWEAWCIFCQKKQIIQNRLVNKTLYLQIKAQRFPNYILFRDRFQNFIGYLRFQIFTIFPKFVINTRNFFLENKLGKRYQKIFAIFTDQNFFFVLRPAFKKVKWSIASFNFCTYGTLVSIWIALAITGLD